MLIRNIAIISKGLNCRCEEKIAALLSKELTKYYNVYLFLLSTEDIVYDYGGTIVNLGQSGSYYEYEIKFYKEVYKIDVAISFLEIMNFANIRSRGREKVVVSEHYVRSLTVSPAISRAIKIRRYYDFADKIVSSSEEATYDLVHNYRIKNKIETIYNTIDKENIEKYTNYEFIKQWRNVIEECVKKEKIDIIKFENNLLNGAKHIFIYGAGFVGKSIFLRLSKQYKIDGFVVSRRKTEEEKLLETPIYEISELNYPSKDTAMIIGVSDSFQDEVLYALQKYGFTQYVFPFIEPFSYHYYISCSKLNIKKELLDWYKLYTGKDIDIEHPCTFNEKIQWLKLYDNTSIKTKLSDKYEVRKYVMEKIGEKYLVPLLGVWNTFDQINFSKLPDQFVLKCTHGSGMNWIVKDKSLMDYYNVKNLFDGWMNINYAYMSGFELHYADIVPRIVAEKMLITDNGEDLRDYKVFVFHGKVKLIQVDIDRQHLHKRNLYTPEWEYVPVSILYPTAPEVIIEKPLCLNELIYLSEILAKPFIHVRVDFYIVKEQIFFGELTFLHGSGIEKFEPEEYGLEMGSWMNLMKGE